MTLGLKYYDGMEDAPLSVMLIQYSIKTENQLMVFSDFSWQDFSDIGRSTGSYNIFYHGVPIDHDTYVPGPFSQSSA